MGLPADKAACVPMAFGTAGDTMFEFGRLQRGRRYWCIRARAGWGSPRSNWPDARGCGCWRPPRGDKLARLTELGLDYGISYRKADFAGKVRG